jgi:hypothetical protein
VIGNEPVEARPPVTCIFPAKKGRLLSLFDCLRKIGEVLFKASVTRARSILDRHFVSLSEVSTFTPGGAWLCCRKISTRILGDTLAPATAFLFSVAVCHPLLLSFLKSCFFSKFDQGRLTHRNPWARHFPGIWS